MVGARFVDGEIFIHLFEKSLPQSCFLQKIKIKKSEGAFLFWDIFDDIRNCHFNAENEVGRKKAASQFMNFPIPSGTQQFTWSPDVPLNILRISQQHKALTCSVGGGGGGREKNAEGTNHS